MVWACDADSRGYFMAGIFLVATFKQQEDGMIDLGMTDHEMIVAVYWHTFAVAWLAFFILGWKSVDWWRGS
jgi:hypothetical protein